MVAFGAKRTSTGVSLDPLGREWPEAVIGPYLMLQ